MNLKIQNTTDNIDWNLIPELLKKVGMGYTTADIHKTAFENSFIVCFVFDDNKLIGFGRSISDGVRQAAIYDVAIEPTYQGKGIGKQILKNIMDATPNCTFVLYAALGKEEFYKKIGFKVMKTGMILFNDSSKMNDSNWVVV